MDLIMSVINHYRNESLYTYSIMKLKFYIFLFQSRPLCSNVDVC